MKTFTKAFALLFAVLMAVSSLVACSQAPAATTAPAATSTPAASEQASAAATEQPAPEPTTNEPITMTVKLYHAPNTGVENYADTPVGKYIKEKLNITINLLPSTADNKEIVTDLAANNVPDIFDSWITPIDFTQVDVLHKAATEGVLADLTDAVKKYSPTIEAAVAPDHLPIFVKNTVYSAEFGGKLYMLPMNYSVQNPWLSGWGLYIRGDIADKLQIATPAVIKSSDDLYNLLVKIKDAKITDTNGKPIYPLGMIQPWPQIVSAVTRPYDFGGNMKIGIKDGKISGFIESQYAKDQVLWIRKLLKEGLLDPESFTQKYEIGAEKLAQGKYGVLPFFAAFALPDGTDYEKTLTTGHPEMALKPLGNMNNNLGNDTNVINKGMEACQAVAVSAKTNVDAAIKLLDLLCSKEGKATATFGAKGVQWDFNAQGFAQMTDEGFKAYKNDPKFTETMGTGVLSYFGMITGVDDPNYNIFGGDGRDA